MSSPGMCFGQNFLFFCESRSKHAFFFQCCCCLQCAKATIECHGLARAPHSFCQSQQQTNCFAKQPELFCRSFRQFVFPFHEFNCTHCSSQTTADGMVLIAKRPRLPQNTRTTRTSEITDPFGHGFVKTQCPGWNKNFLHAIIPRLNDVTNLPKLVKERRRGFVCEVQSPKYILKAVSGHVLVLTEWSSFKWRRRCFRVPKVATFIEVCC